MENEEIEKMITERQIAKTDKPPQELSNVNTSNVLGTVKEDILQGAKQKLDNQKTKDKHSKKLAEVADTAIEAEIEIERLKVSKIQAKNKADKRAIANELYVLKQEHKRNKKEQKSLNENQRLEYQKIAKEKKWETYGKSLQTLGYDYVPNIIVLSIIMFLVGAKAFFNGIAKTGDSMVKALKWIILVVAILAIIFIIPVTREWLLSILGYIK